MSDDVCADEGDALEIHRPVSRVVFEEDYFGDYS